MYDYRIIETETENYFVNDEGPGSFRHICGRSRSRVIDEYKNESDEFKNYLLKEIIWGLNVQEDDPRGIYEYSYKVERKETGSDEWQYVGYLNKYKYIDDEY